MSPRPAEAWALKVASRYAGDRVLCTSLGRAQAALELAGARPAASVVAWFLDQHHQRLAANHVDAQVPNLQVVCAADPPQGQLDLAVVPLHMHGEAELARDILQTTCQQLTSGGTLVAAVDNPRDRWLHDVLRRWFDKITVHRSDSAIAYAARKSRQPHKWIDFRCRFAFRDEGNLVFAVSRPGVFAHRRIDPGARQLLATARVGQGTRVLDIGCGSGVVGLALAKREPTSIIHSVDGNARAVECTLAGAQLNALNNVTAELNSTGECGAPGDFDLVVANPPYYADFRIAELFLQAARRSLRTGGKFIVVTKYPAWYEQAMAGAWTSVRCSLSKRYHLVEALRP